MLIIPTTNDGSRRVSVDLGEQIGVYIFRTYWNPTAGMWSADILDSDENPLVLGIALPPTINICDPYPELRDIFQELRIADIAGTGNATPASMGSDAILGQYNEGEVQQPDGIYDPIVDLEDVIGPEPTPAPPPPLLPSWSFNSEALILPPEVSFSRNSPATLTNKNGLLEVVGNDIPRFEYDAQTKGLIGWLIEGVFTNRATYSQQYDNAAWTKLNSTITANAAIDPEGGMTADKLLDNAANKSHEVYQTHAVTSGVTYVWSTCLLAGEYEFGFCCMTMEPLPINQYLAVIDLTTGEVTTTNVIGTPTNTRYFVEELAKGFWRLTVRMTSPVTGNMLVHAGLSPSASPYLFNGRPRVVGDGTKGIYLWQSDFGEGWYPTSPVPTTTTAVARASDQKETAASALGIPLDGSDFETCGEFVLAADAGVNSQYLVCYHDSTNSNLIFVVRDNTSKMSFGITVGGVQSTTVVGPTITGRARVRFACKVSASGCRMTLAVNGVDLGNGIGRAVTYGASTSDTIPTGLTTKSIGNRSTDYTRRADCICVRDFDYATALSSSDAETLISFA